MFKTVQSFTSHIYNRWCLRCFPLVQRRQFGSKVLGKARRPHQETWCSVWPVPRCVGYRWNREVCHREEPWLKACRSYIILRCFWKRASCEYRCMYVFGISQCSEFLITVQTTHGNAAQGFITWQSREWKQLLWCLLLRVSLGSTPKSRVLLRLIHHNWTILIFFCSKV